MPKIRFIKPEEMGITLIYSGESYNATPVFEDDDCVEYWLDDGQGPPRYVISAEHLEAGFAEIVQEIPDKPRILIFDIEVSPNVGDVWGLWKQNIGLNQLRKSGEVMSFAAKWYGEDEIFYKDCREDTEEVDVLMDLSKLFSEADAVVAHNGDRFDVPWVKGRMLQLGLGVPAPVKQIDTLKIAKRNFRFPSNRLDYIAKALGHEGKLKSKKFMGHDLWTQCIVGNTEAWKEMEAYNKQDVVILEDVFRDLTPYIKGFNFGLYNTKDEHQCPQCGGTHLHKRGFAYTTVGKYQRYVCTDCNGWSRGAVNLTTKEKRSTLLRTIANAN